jgi:hypothetical protein
MNVFFTELLFKCIWIFQVSPIITMILMAIMPTNVFQHKQQKEEKLLATEYRLFITQTPLTFVR